MRLQIRCGSPQAGGVVDERPEADVAAIAERVPDLAADVVMVKTQTGLRGAAYSATTGQDRVVLLERYPVLVLDVPAPRVDPVLLWISCSTTPGLISTLRLERFGVRFPPRLYAGQDLVAVLRIPSSLIIATGDTPPLRRLCPAAFAKLSTDARWLRTATSHAGITLLLAQGLLLGSGGGPSQAVPPQFVPQRIPGGAGAFAPPRLSIKLPYEILASTNPVGR